MTIKEIKRAVAEAKRFIAVANEAVTRLETDGDIYAFSGTEAHGGTIADFIEGLKR